MVSTAGLRLCRGIAVSSKWLLVGLFCLLVGRSAAAGEPPQEFSDTVGRATQPSRLSGLDEPLEMRVKRVRFEPSRLPGSGLVLAQPTSPAAPSRNWFSRHPVLVGVIAGVTVGTVAAATGDNKLFCPGGDESCVLHSAGLKVFGVGVFGAVGGLIGFLASIGK